MHSRSHHRPAPSLALLALAAALGLGGCDSSANGAAGEHVDRAIPGPVEDLLQRVPASGFDWSDPPGVTVNDYRRAFEASGLHRQAEGREETIQGLRRVSLEHPFLQDQWTDPRPVRDAGPLPLPYGVDRLVSAGTSCNGVAVAVGQDHEVRPTGLATVAPGVLGIGDGAEGRPNLPGRHPYSMLGCPVRIASKGDAVAYGSRLSQVQAFLDGQTSLAADPDVRAVARALDAEGVYTATVQRPISQSRDGSSVTGLPSYTLRGVGISVHDGAQREHIVLRFPDEAAAARGERAYQQFAKDGSMRDAQRPFAELASDPAVRRTGLLVTFSYAPRPAGGVARSLLVSMPESTAPLY